MSDRQLTNGQPVPEDGSHKEIDPISGQQKGYVVLSPEERAKGFVKPVRRSYTHVCGSLTTMGTALAETYARNPYFYSGTFCCTCSEHFPLSEFVWEPDGEPMEPSEQAAWLEAQKQRLIDQRLLQDAETEATERAELARLKMKYEPDSAPQRVSKP